MLALSVNRPNVVLIRENTLIKDNQIDLTTEKYPQLVYFMVHQLGLIITSLLSNETEMLRIIRQQRQPQRQQQPQQPSCDTCDTCDHKMICDYIFLSFLLGNDFLPACPMLKIKNGGIEKLLLAYNDMQKQHRIDPSHSHPHPPVDVVHIYVCQDAHHVNQQLLSHILQCLSSNEQFDLQEQQYELDRRRSTFTSFHQTPTCYEEALEH